MGKHSSAKSGIAPRPRQQRNGTFSNLPFCSGRSFSVTLSDFLGVSEKNLLGWDSLPLTTKAVRELRLHAPAYAAQVGCAVALQLAKDVCMIVFLPDKRPASERVSL